MQLLFIGAGYVGLVSATMMSSLGFSVTCYDSDKDKIASLKKGKMPIYEPGLEGYIKAGILAKRLSFESSLTKNADIVFIAVGTPSLESGEADLSNVYDAALQVAKHYNKDTLIVIKSTVPPGTCASVGAKLRENGLEHRVASNPEFLREGSAIEDFLNPDRIVIGTADEISTNILRSLYASLTKKGLILLSTDTATSELIKYASNSFLATKIGFINEMANLCEKVGANIDLLSTGMGLDSRIGAAFLKAGPGFGGSCFPKDLLALSHLAKQHKQPCSILDAVISSNQSRPACMVDKITKALGKLNDKIICVLGVTFKAGTDDVRSSPAVDIINLLLQSGAKVRVYDPEGMENAKKLLPNAEFIDNPYEAAISAEALVILTEWNEFKELDFTKLRDNLRAHYIFDLRNILDEERMSKIGFSYFKVGK